MTQHKIGERRYKEAEQQIRVWRDQIGGDRGNYCPLPQLIICTFIKKKEKRNLHSGQQNTDTATTRFHSITQLLKFLVGDTAVGTPEPL